jgi:hypothetical protein
MKTRTYFLLICILSGIQQLIAQPTNYDAVYLSLIKEYTLNPDGSIDYRVKKIQKLLNYPAFHRLFGETFIVYNPKSQQLRIHESFTEMADGKRVITPENAFNEVLPRFAALAPDFNGLREMVITHTGLEIGATIYLDYSIHSEPGFFPALMAGEVLAENQPVNELTVQVKIPASMELRYKLYNSVLQPSESLENGMRTYTWTSSDIPPIPTEDRRPLHHAADPYLIFSTLKSFKPLISWYTGQEMWSDTLPAALQKQISLRSEEKKDPIARAFLWQETIINQLRLSEIPAELTGYRLRKPARTWNSNGGTPAEKAILLASILKYDGMDANPVAVFNGCHFDPEVASLSELDDWLVCITTPEGEPMYLSVKQLNAYDMAILLPDQAFLSFSANGFNSFSRPGPGHGEIALTANLSLDSAYLLSGTIQGKLAGACNPRLAFLRDSLKLKHYLGGGIGSSEIRKLEENLTDPQKTDFTCTIQKPKSMRLDSNFRFLLLPVIRSGMENLGISSLPDTRSGLLEIPATLDERYSFTLSVPGNLIPVSIPGDFRIENPAGSLIFSIRNKEGVLEISKEIRINHTVISPERYKDFKDLVDHWNLRQTREIIFRKR